MYKLNINKLNKTIKIEKVKYRFLDKIIILDIEHLNNIKIILTKFFKYYKKYKPKHFITKNDELIILVLCSKYGYEEIKEEYERFTRQFVEFESLRGLFYEKYI